MYDRDSNLTPFEVATTAALGASLITFLQGHSPFATLGITVITGALAVIVNRFGLI